MVGSGRPDLYDTSPHNLFPVVFNALVTEQTPHINGEDYPTGRAACATTSTSPISSTPVVAARALAAGEPLKPVYNLGSGDASSVRQLMDTVRDVTGIDFTRGPAATPWRPCTDRRVRRPGPPRPRLDHARHDLRSMVATACEAVRAHHPGA